MAPANEKRETIIINNQRYLVTPLQSAGYALRISLARIRDSEGRMSPTS